MENHPIPQDVTGFQFKLIGNMTLKQFAYVATGVILAVILYYMPLNAVIGTFIKIIFIPLFGGSGFLIAFLPIEGRPVDIMAANFLKALFSPNQFVYHKTGRLLNFTTLPTRTTLPKGIPTASVSSNKTRQIQSLLKTTHVATPNKLDEKETAFLASISNISMPDIAPTLNTSTPQLQTIQTSVNKPQMTTGNLEEKELNLSEQLESIKKEELSSQPSASSAAHQKAIEIEEQIQALHAQKQQLDQELQQLKGQLPSQPVTSKTAPIINSIQTISSATAAPKIQSTKRTDLPHVPDIPNVIVGIVKDPRGNVLPNMLVEVKDKDGNPVRAFKTNPLGQFASATPIAPGSYTVELEDPKKKNTFSTIQLIADNRILMPIEIVSHDSREELRKQLFN